MSNSNQHVQEFSKFEPWFQIHHFAMANSKETRKRKIEEEMQNFNEKWTSEYFVIENADSRPLCLICEQTVSVNKEYNIKRHYDSKHANDVYGKLKGRNIELKVEQLKEQLKSQHLMFQKMHTDNEKTV